MNGSRIVATFILIILGSFVEDAVCGKRTRELAISISKDQLQFAWNHVEWAYKQECWLEKLSKIIYFFFSIDALEKIFFFHHIYW